MFWVVVGPALPVPAASGTAGRRPALAHTMVIGWAGLRGVVTLAAAFLIPADVADREVLVFGAMVVTAGTLLIQG